MDRRSAALIVFIVIGSLGVGAPVAIYFGMGERSAAILADLRDWMTHNNAAIMVVLCLDHRRQADRRRDHRPQCVTRGHDGHRRPRVSGDA